MEEEQRETADWKKWVWVWLLLVPAYLLSAFPVAILCDLYPPSTNLDLCIRTFYWPLSLLLQFFPALQDLFIEIYQWLKAFLHL